MVRGRGADGGHWAIGPVETGSKPTADTGELDCGAGADDDRPGFGPALPAVAARTVSAWPRSAMPLADLPSFRRVRA
jgi:hypothetical protein